MNNANDEPYEVNTNDLDIPEYWGEGYYELRFMKAPDLYWRISKVNAGHEQQRAAFVTGGAPNPPPSTDTHAVTSTEVRAREIAILFAGTNIVRKDGTPAAPTSGDLLDIEKFVLALPAEMANEIWVRIGDIYPRWGPSRPDDWGSPEDQWVGLDGEVPFAES